MKSLNFYLAFPGNCKEALDFYKNCFNGEIVSMHTFGEGPEGMCGDADKSKIMHAEFKADGVYFMASDSMGDHKVNAGNNVSLSLNIDNEKDQESIFNKLSDGGKVTMPLQDTFWGAKFGMLIDRFGFNWMLNCEKK